MNEIIAFCGTRGVPANYGGFETAVDEISQRFVSKGYSVEVFCRSSHSKNELVRHTGRNLTYVPGSDVPSLETFVSSIQTGWRLLSHAKVYRHAFWFNNANLPGILMTLIAGIPTSVNTDGLEWRRRKWSWPFKAYYYLSSFLLSRLCPTLISDSKAVQQIYLQKFGRRTCFIPYGIPHRVSVSREEQDEILEQFHLISGKYFLQITRFEPDNLPLENARGFQQSDLGRQDCQYVLVGYHKPTPYADSLKSLSASDGILVLPAVYDPKVLFTLRSNCFCYVHGNSVGGTNPALLEAMDLCPRIMAIDCEFSHELLGSLGLYFHPELIHTVFQEALKKPDTHTALSAEVRARYQWDEVSTAYIGLVK